MTVSISHRDNNGKILVKGPLGTLEKTFDAKKVDVKSAEGKVDVVLKARPSRKSNAVLGTFEVHVQNMIKGVQKKYEKKLALAYLHFPPVLEIKGKEVLIKTFLGEKVPRKCKIQGTASVEVKGEEIIVSGIDKEDVGQTASNLVKATAIRSKDRRVFQDGIYYKV